MKSLGSNGVRTCARVVMISLNGVSIAGINVICHVVRSCDVLGLSSQENLKKYR